MALKWQLSRGIKGLVCGSAWGAAAGLLEAALFKRWYRVELLSPLGPAELALNYALYAGFCAVLLWIVVDSRRTDRTGTRPVNWPEAVLGAGFVVGVVANFVRVGPLGAPLLSATTFALMLGSLLIAGLGAWALRGIPQKWMTLVRGGLGLWIAFSLLWPVLFGPYTGRFGGSDRTAEPGSLRNLVFIVTDTERSDFLNCYGSDWNASPAADRVAASGAVFENHYAQSTWTLPSVASLLTGRFPSSHGAVAHAHAVAEDAVTLPEMLQDSGFRTGAFSENFHILPRNGFGRGFDRFWAVSLPWVFDEAALYRVTTNLGLPRVEFVEKAQFPHPIVRPDQVNWDARVTTDHALKWLQGLDDAPFALYVHYMGPHSPYGPPKFLLDREAPDVPLIDHPRPIGGGLPIGEAGAAATGEAVSVMKTLYAADILYVERQIERLIDWLEHTKKLDDTVIVLTSDHGEEFYEHRAWNHGGSAFNEVLRVPLIVAAPGLVPTNSRVGGQTRHIDVMPTVLDLLGISPPDGMQGRSLRPLLESQPHEPLPAYAEIYPLRPTGSSMRSLVKGHHKIIEVTVEDDTAVLLFDLHSDPLESHDLHADLPELRESLLEEMALWDLVAHEHDPTATLSPLDPQQLDALKSLGYIN